MEQQRTTAIRNSAWKKRPRSLEMHWWCGDTSSPSFPAIFLGQSPPRTAALTALASYWHPFLAHGTIQIAADFLLRASPYVDTVSQPHLTALLVLLLDPATPRPAPAFLSLKRPFLGLPSFRAPSVVIT